MQQIKNYKGLTYAVAILWAFQTVLPGMNDMPGMTEYGYILISAIIMFSSQVVTAIQQYIAEGINNKALRPTLFLLLLSILGWLNDLFKVVHISDFWGQWIRWIITFANLILNICSKLMFPTVAQKAVNIQNEMNN